MESALSGCPSRREHFSLSESLYCQFRGPSDAPDRIGHQFEDVDSIVLPKMVGEKPVLWNNSPAAHTVLLTLDGRDGTKDFQAVLAAIRG